MSIGDAGASGDAQDAPDALQARRILDQLRDFDIDAAIEAGLARFKPLSELDDESNGLLSAARDRLLAAWAARERHRARDVRLARIANDRLRARGGLAAGNFAGAAAADEAAVGSASRSARAPGTDACASTEPGSGDGNGLASAAARPSLPPAAAAALARARARASGKQP